MFEILRQQLHDDLIAGVRWCVALSGGIDSSALLHAVVQLAREFPGNPVRAVHVNHHLHADSDAWTVVCQSLCNELGVLLICRDVVVETDGEAGIEAAARKVRYAALLEELGPDERLLTAHHRDDQVETLLLRLLRGAGPHGLASIGPHRPFGTGRLLRPLLDVGRDALETYARSQNLTWIDDPANTDTSFDRNFLRHHVLPLLRERWPGLGETIARAARLSGEAACMLDGLAEADIAGLAGSGGGEDSQVAELLPVEFLCELSPARRRNVVRYWLRRRGVLPPAEIKMRDSLEQLLTAGADRMPLIEWGGVQIRRYRNYLYLLEYDPNPGDCGRPDSCDWDGRGSIDLGPLRGGLRFVRVDETAVDVPQSWIVRFRAGGERFAVAGRHKSVKQLFQERGVVPWMRAHVPLLYLADRLVAVGDFWQADDIGRTDDGDPVRVVWAGHPQAH